MWLLIHQVYFTLTTFILAHKKGCNLNDCSLFILPLLYFKMFGLLQLFYAHHIDWGISNDLYTFFASLSRVITLLL